MKNHKIKYTKDKSGQFRASVTAPNGNILFVTSESYKRKAGAKKAMASLAKAFMTGRVIEV